MMHTGALCRRTLLLGATGAGALLPGVAGSGQETLPPVNGPPILTISGRIAATNRNGSAVFDLEGLETLGLETVTTATPWFDGPQRFEGVPMARILRAVKAQGTVVTAIALNDYSTDIPVADFTRYNVILATKRNGEYMRVRDKGPLFIVYPYDSAPELRGQPFYGRSAWQVAQLIVK